MPKRFSRKVENFVCSNCGFEVEGTGYTDHCPRCLWSRHVDNNPGDRASKCKGMMEPIGAESERTQIVIIYKCLDCGAKKRVLASAEDNEELLSRLLG